jgi:hypothetical protein
VPRAGAVLSRLSSSAPWPAGSARHRKLSQNIRYWQASEFPRVYALPECLRLAQ